MSSLAALPTPLLEEEEWRLFDFFLWLLGDGDREREELQPSLTRLCALEESTGFILLLLAAPLS